MPCASPGVPTVVPARLLVPQGNAVAVEQVEFAGGTIKLAVNVVLAVPIVRVVLALLEDATDAPVPETVQPVNVHP